MLNKSISPLLSGDFLVVFILPFNGKSPEPKTRSVKSFIFLTKSQPSSYMDLYSC